MCTFVSRMEQTVTLAIARVGNSQNVPTCITEEDVVR
jgi:hypothetical protein